VRRRALHGRIELTFPWLRPPANALLTRATLEDELRQPTRWDRQLLEMWRTRPMQKNLRRIAALAAEADVAVHHPFAESEFVAALAREGGRFGFQTRTAAMHRLFSKVMPSELNERPTKAAFHEVVFNRHSRAFIDALDEERLAHALESLELAELVDPRALLAEWRGPEPSANSFLLLQACWLALDQ
jgi:asparagine synthase (glutamine-hydrolysing)